MNERIKELAEQAKNDLVTEIHSKATGMDINIVKIIVLGSKLKDHYAQDFSTKFAQLLVFECVNAVMDGTKEGDHYAQRIEQHFDNGQGGILHFGVEE